MADPNNGSVRVSRGGNWSFLTICYAITPSFTGLVLFLYLFGSLLINGWVKPITQRGFFCGDSSINYPFKPDTISLKTLLFFALFIPSLLIKLCDKHLHKLLEASNGHLRIIQNSPNSRRRKDSGVIQDTGNLEEEEELITSSDKVKRRNLVLNEDDSDYELIDSEAHQDQNQKSESSDENGVVTQLRVPTGSDNEGRRTQVGFSKPKYSETQLFIFGFATTMLFTGIGKLAGGRFRPHFMQRCQPDTDCSLATNANKYIVHFACTNKNLRPEDFSYITTSWPSGHASTIFYSMLYLIAYLNTVIPLIAHLNSRRVERKFNLLLLYVIDVLLIGLAGYIAMTRVSDYHHHPLDILSGSILGSIVAIAFSKTLSMKNLTQLISQVRGLPPT